MISPVQDGERALAGELGHEGEAEGGLTLAPCGPQRRRQGSSLIVLLLLPAVLLHDHLLEHPGRHLGLGLVRAQRRRPVLPDEELQARSRG